MSASGLTLPAEIERSGVIELLAALVRLRSHPGIPRQEEQVAWSLRDYLASHGLSVDLVEAAPGRPNVLCTVAGKRPGRHLVLCGHTDTVPLNQGAPGAGFAAEIRDGWMYGRGTVDMKGGVAATAAALVALHRAGALGAGKVTLAAVVDEECESIGVERLIESGFRADGGVIGEPTSNRVCLGHKGLEWIEIEFRGKAAHGGTPQAGINAIVAASRFIQLTEERLQPLLRTRAHPLLGSPTFNLGTIRGGDQPSTVAATCVLAADRRSVPGETAKSMFAELREILDAVERTMPGLRTEARRMPGGMAKLEHLACATDADHALARAALAACSEVRGQPDEPTAFGAWTDASLLSNFAGIPCLVLGPGELAVAHSPDERVSIREVMDAALIYAEIALSFCGD